LIHTVTHINRRIGIQELVLPNSITDWPTSLSTPQIPVHGIVV